MSGNDQPVYTVKEWLQRLDQKLDTLDEKLDTKADTATVLALEQRIRALEQEKADRSELAVFWKTFLGFVATAASAIFVWALTVLRGAGKL